MVNCEHCGKTMKRGKQLLPFRIWAYHCENCKITSYPFEIIEGKGNPYYEEGRHWNHGGGLNK